MAFIQSVKNFFSSGQKNSFDLMSIDTWRNIFSLNRRFNPLTSSNLHDAYSQHELVYACVNKTADVMNDAEIIVEKKNAAGDWEKVEGHPLGSIFKRPNPFETGRAFRRLMVQSELTSAIFYGEMIRSRAGLVVEIYALNPNCVKPKLTQDKTKIAYFEFTRSDGQIRRIEPENMLIRRRSDLVNRFFGLSPVQVALKAINSDLGMSDYIDAFFENDGTPSGLLSILNATLNATKKEAIASDWRRKYSRGGRNQKGIAVLDQDMKFESIGSKMNELESDSLTGRSETKICTVFGVPPILVGAFVGLRHTTANATAKAALTDFWDNKISPELAELREWMTWFVLPEFEELEDIKAEKVRVAFDISNAKFLQEDVDAIYERAGKAYDRGGITQNEYREKMGFEAVAEGDNFKPANVPMSLQAVPTNEDDEKSTHTPKLLTSKKNSYRRELSEIEKIIDIKSIESDVATSSAQLEKIIKRIRTDLIEQAGKNITSLEDLADFDLEVSSKDRKSLTKIIETAFERGQSQVIKEIELQTGKSSNNPETKKLDGFDVGTLVNLVIARIVSEVKKRAVNIAAVLYSTTDEFDESELESQLKDESEKQFEQFSRNFANAGIAAGRFDILKSDERIGKYEYSAILDANVCSPCEQWDGTQADDINDLPSTPNNECDGEWNCRCFVVGIVI